MKLIKGNREVTWIPFNNDMRTQVRKGKHGRQYGYVEFEGTKEELAMAKRLGRKSNRQHAWVALSSMHEGS